jgi:hypothetical protein
MEWIWELFKPHILKQFLASGQEHPADEDVARAFMKLLAESTVTILVQEPWQNSVRFKALDRLDWSGMGGLVEDPMGYLEGRFGGGKFKLNFHQGWNFIATQNFKPEAPPRWKDLPEIEPV